MRSYKQYCAIAKALDVIGDRWNMLIVRELLLQGACRYTDLHDGLPGIADRVGYQSEAAFSRAFKRELSHSPAAWRRQAAFRT